MVPALQRIRTLRRDAYRCTERTVRGTMCGTKASIVVRSDEGFRTVCEEHA